MLEMKVWRKKDFALVEEDHVRDHLHKLTDPWVYMRCTHEC